MKQFVTLLTFIFFLCQLTSAQKVDSVKVEQSGDFIKIRYKILNSKAGEVYRVKVLASINGRLKTELESISGDAGDQVPGGKADYWVVWDVLKDVDEVRSADFIVRTELLKGVPSIKKPPEENVSAATVNTWAQKRFNVLLTLLGPGPKTGIRAGYMGSWGITGQVVSGKTEKGETSYEPSNSLMYGFDITKRTINRNNIQMHLLLGIQRASLLFYNPDYPWDPYSMEDVAGPEGGFMFGLSHLSFFFTVTHFNTGQIEDGTNMMAVSPYTYMSFGLGARF